MNTALRWPVRHPLAVLGASLALTIVLGLDALGLRIESALENVVPAGDPAIAYYQEVRATFGSDDVAVVGLRADDVLSPQTLATIKRVTDALARLDGVEAVISLTNAPDPAEDVVLPPRLLPRIPPTVEEVAALKRKLAQRPLYAKNLLADDYRGAAINVFFAPLTQAEYMARDIDGRIQAILDAETGPERFYYTGAGHLQQEALRLMRHDLLFFTPIAAGVVFLVLSIAFRTARVVLLPLGAVLLALVWTLGIMALTGKGLTLGTFILPALILVIGSAGAMHVMAAYYEEAAVDGGDDGIVERTVRRVWVPVVISGLTTAVGFGSLTVNRIPAIRDLGLFAVVGVAGLTVSTLTFLPASLQLLGVGSRGTRTAMQVGPLVRLLTAIGRRAYDSRRTILVATAALLVAALVGAQRIKVNSDLLGYFEPDSGVRHAHELINEEIVGTNPFFLVVEGKAPEVLARWDTLRRIKDLQDFLRDLPGITSSISIVDWLELLESGLNKSGAGDLLVDERGNLVPTAAPVSFWKERKNLEPVLDIVRTSPKTFRAVITPDFSRANIVVRTRLSSSHEVEAALARIQERLDGFPGEVRVRPTGTLALFTGTSSSIVAGQVKSLSLALVVIFIVMTAMFLSLKVGWLAVLPNLLSIAIFFGLLGWTGISLDLGTSLIAAIALGLAVDVSIHYMSRLNHELKKEADQRAAVMRALRAVGRPIVYTTIALCLGFFTLGCSSFVPVRQFGILSGITLAAALAANVVVLPALLATTTIITLWDLLNVKLGQDPARTIPLFAGLRPAQARIAVLMGEIKQFAPSEYIVRRGEESAEMYVMIHGAVDVWAGAGPDRRRIATHRRGDVFGEMGLLRHAPRSADVVAAGAVEVLAVNERFIQRLRGRYPRIAARVFFNLTRILSDRLQRMTEELVAGRQPVAAAGTGPAGEARSRSASG